MALDKLYIEDVGHVFTFKTETDLSSVNTATIELSKPDNVGSATWIASVSAATSGQVVYITQSGDLDTTGWWEAQVKVWESATSNFHGNTFNFHVFPLKE
jgi:hypothetical protein